MTSEEDFLLCDLEPVLSRPKMYFGKRPTAKELAAFVNGYMAHRSGMMWGGFCFACKANPNKTLEENALRFKQQIIDWARSPNGPGPSGKKWRCCVRGQK